MIFKCKTNIVFLKFFNLLLEIQIELFSPEYVELLVKKEFNKEFDINW